MGNKPRLLIISMVLPFPRSSGQQQRVYYSIKALRRYFHVTLLTTSPHNITEELTREIREYCDDAIVLPSIYNKNIITRLFYHSIGNLIKLHTGLKLSNYVIGQVELAPNRIAKAIQDKLWDVVLFEYWHAVDCIEIFHLKNIPCVLDMHNILWQSYQRQHQAKRCIPEAWKNRSVESYRVQEELAWNRFNAVIAINNKERQYVENVVSEEIKVFFAPMGTDLSAYAYLWEPALPPRIAYYGGLNSTHNQQDAFECYRKIMPIIWKRYPETELWLVGNNPPDFLRQISRRDNRVVVTGFVEEVQNVLSKLSIILCPWSGTYGFRSRIVEVMALGVPVIASSDAVYGMDMDNGGGIFLEQDLSHMALRAIELLDNRKILEEQSKLARQQIEKKYGFENTYGQLAIDLYTYIISKRQLSRA